MVLSDTALCLLRPNGQRSHMAAEPHTAAHYSRRFPVIGFIRQAGHTEEEAWESLAILENLEIH